MGYSLKTCLDFSEGDWQRIRRDWTAWWEGELDRPLIMVEAVPDPADRAAAPLPAREFNPFITRFPLDMPVDQVLEICEPSLYTLYHALDSFPKWFPNFGPGIIAGFLGARVEYQPGTTWFHKIGLDSLAELAPVYDPGAEWWRRVLEITAAAVARWGSRVTIGHTDLGGNLDILASLRGTEELLADLVLQPTEVDRCTGSLTALWLRYYDELHALTHSADRGMASWAPCWQPARGYLLQSDFSVMISPKMFDRWVLPDLAQCSEALEYAFYHLDGPGQLHHLDALLSIPHLRGIQWIPGAGAPPPEEWLELLKRIRASGKLVQVYVSPTGAQKMLDALDGKGLLLVLRGEDGERYLTLSEAREFLNSVAL